MSELGRHKYHSGTQYKPQTVFKKILKNNFDLNLFFNIF